MDEIKIKIRKEAAKFARETLINYLDQELKLDSGNYPGGDETMLLFGLRNLDIDSFV